MTRYLKVTAQQPLRNGGWLNQLRECDGDSCITLSVVTADKLTMDDEAAYELILKPKESES